MPLISDPEAPIIPGERAAGIRLGLTLETVLEHHLKAFVEEPVLNALGRATGTTRYCSSFVDVWVKGGSIIEVKVHGAYRGKLAGVIGLGSTIEDIERVLGPCGEDEEDNLVIMTISGLCFEIEGFFPEMTNPASRMAPIKEIWVSPSQEQLPCSPLPPVKA